MMHLDQKIKLSDQRQHEPAQILKAIESRHRAMVAVRNYFASDGFFEIDSPLLIPANCIETHIDPILVKVNCGEKGITDRYLHTSPEIYHKRLLSYGAQKIYQLGHVFRDGELGKRHLPEFALLEWYRAGASLEDLICDCEKIFSAVSRALIQKTEIQLANGSVIDLSKPFERCKMEDLWKEHARIDLRLALEKMRDGDQQALVKAAQEKGYALRELATFDDVFHHVMLTQIEPVIGNDRPCVVTDWPIQMAALARPCEEDPLFAERFEIYCGQIELANAFAELVDAAEQARRFQSDLQDRIALGKTPTPVDHQFLDDLRFMPNAAGIAVGFDRLLMLILGQTEISNVYPISYSKL